MAEHQLPKLTVRVRFSSPAPIGKPPTLGGLFYWIQVARRESGDLAPKAAGGSRHPPRPNFPGTHHCVTTSLDHMSVSQWWNQIDAATADWLMDHNGENLPAEIAAEIVAAGGTAAPNEPLPDEDVDWIEAAANGE